MIELSNFDLSAIISKLNQGVTEDTASQGSEFEKILSAHLELSGIKSGIDSPLLDKLVEQMDISEISEATAFKLQPKGGFFDIESTEKNQIASASLPKFEVLPSGSESLLSEASKMKDMQESTGVFVDFSDGFKTLKNALLVNGVSPITTEQIKELPEATGVLVDFSDGFKALKNALLANGVSPITTEQIKELPEAKGVLVDFSDGFKAFKNALFAYNLNPIAAGYVAPETPKAANRQEAGLSNLSEALSSSAPFNFLSLVTEDPNTAVLKGDREGYASEFVVNHASTPRELGPSFQSLLASSKITSMTSERNQGSGPGVRTYSDSELAAPKSAGQIISEIQKSGKGAKAERLIAGSSLDQPSIVHAGDEGNESKSQSGRSDAGFVEIKRSDNSSDRRLKEGAPGGGNNIEQRSRLLNSYNGSYIETLSGQRQVLVGSRQSKYNMAELASELAVKEQVDMKSGKTNSREITPSQPSTIAHESNIQSFRHQDGLLGLSRGAQNRTRAMVEKSRVSYSKVGELKRHGQLRGIDAQQATNSTLQDISKVLSADDKKTGTKLDVINELTVGRIGDLPSADQATERRNNTTSTNLQLADPLTPLIVREDQAAEGIAKRTGPSTFQAELDFSGYDARRSILREELDQRVAQLIRGVRSQINSGQLNELQIKLHPRELGIITFGIELLDGNEISVKILSAPDDASKLMKEHWPAHWQDAGGKAPNLEAGEKGLFGSNSSPRSDGENDRNWERAAEDVADSAERFAEQDSNRDLAENGHNIDITI